MTDQRHFKYEHFDDFRHMAQDPSLSEYEKIGFPDSYRAGYGDAMFADIRRKLTHLEGAGQTVLDIGPGCSDLPRLMIDLCRQQGHRLILVDAKEMLDLLPDESFILKIPAYYPDECPQLFNDYAGKIDAILTYSVLHHIFAEGNVFRFLDRSLSLLAEGGQFLIGDIPNESRRKRFFSSESGIRFHQNFMQTSETPHVEFNKLDVGALDDALVFSLLTRARLAGFDSYLLPQSADLPMANRREDLLFLQAMSIRVERYGDPHGVLWDDFVRRSKNGTFLFERGYMDYHRDRFADHSLIVYDDQQVAALLPANQKDLTLVSHGGLTYGGLITDTGMKTPLMLRVFEAALAYYRDQGLIGIRYKAMPTIYPRIPAQEDLYALFLCGAQVAERSVMTVIGASERIPLPKGRRYSLSKARKHGLRVCRADDQLSAYWELLEESLRERHDARPVHTLAEMERLQARFPREIQLYICYDGTALVAGVLIFESACVARTQYIAVSERGRETCALDLLMDHLLNEVFARKPFFDFGTSHDPASGALNGGLIEQKESFGGRALAQDTYWIDLEHWNPERIRGAVR